MASQGRSETRTTRERDRPGERQGVTRGPPLPLPLEADEVTVELERQSGAQFDPTVVNAIIRILRSRSSRATEVLASIADGNPS